MSVSAPFSLRVRLGRCEVEISGNHDEVMKTVSDLPNLVATISDAFAQAGVEISEESVVDQTSSQLSSVPVSVVYPSIQSSGNCSDSVLKLLSSDWGRTTPRTLPELIEAMKANAVHFPATTLSGVLNWLVRKGRVKRWKTDNGYVYVLSGPNVGHGQLRIQAQTESNTIAAPSGGG